MSLLQCQVPERRRGEMLPREDGFQWRSRRYIKKEKAEEGKNVKDPLERRGGRGKEIGTYCVCCQGKLSTFFMFLRL